MRFGALEVLRIAGTINNATSWWCKCDCGVEREIRGAKLREGVQKSCGCKQGRRTQEQIEKYVLKCKIIDVTGQRFGHLLAVERIPWQESKSGPAWRCKCDCGGERVELGWMLRRGRVHGCSECHRERFNDRPTTKPIQRKAFRSTSGIHRHPDASVWSGMITRCENPATEGFHNYGGRGIYVCKRWYDFAAFIEDMGPRPSKRLSIERTNVNGSYTCGKCEECITKGDIFHCVWADCKTQSRNKRTNVYVTYGERRLCIGEWAEVFGVAHGSVVYRIKRYGVESAFDYLCNAKGLDRDMLRRPKE